MVAGERSPVLQESIDFFLKPLRSLREYDTSNLRPDLIAGLTVAVVLLPQAIAYALIAELPPQTGLYAAIIMAVVGSLWGSSNHLQTGPTNAISLLILSTLITFAESGTAEFLILAGTMAVMVGIFQLVMGLARLGMLVNFVSHSVIVGFSSAAGVLIALKQLQHLFGLSYESHNLIETIGGFLASLAATHLPTLFLGAGTIALIFLLRRLAPKLPGPLIGMVAAGAVVAILSLNARGVAVLGELPRSLPPLASLPLFDLNVIGELSTGAFAVAAIGLVEAMSIGRSIASQSGQRLDSNQEFIGQGLSNILSGLFSGYPGSGSFTRSAVNFKAGARSPLAGIFSGVFVLIAMLLLAPLAVFVPRAALAGVLIVIAIGMINHREILRIWRGARGDAIIMVVTFFATLLLHLEFAVMTGILLSLAVFALKTSVPRVTSVLPDREFKHFLARGSRPACPQMAVMEISGDLYFGAVSHIEKTILRNLEQNPGQRFLLLRMHRVNQCDFSGIHMLESIVKTFREHGGDVFMVRVCEDVMGVMRATGFSSYLGADRFLAEDEAISYIFNRILEPSICIYECEVRAFMECQNLPKQVFQVQLPAEVQEALEPAHEIHPQHLGKQLGTGEAPTLIDVRESREYKRGHITHAQTQPLSKIMEDPFIVPINRPVVLVCRGGRRSIQAARLLRSRGYQNVSVLKGGMIAWENEDAAQNSDEQQEANQQ